MAIYDVLKNQVANNKQSIFNDVCFAVAAFIRQFTTAENDYAIRFEMDELTPYEARAVVLDDWANYDKNIREAVAWSV